MLWLFAVCPTAYPSSLNRTNNMTSSKAALAPSQQSHECCMCGDYGLSRELFQCKVCQFRSQHSYCSNLYPKAESYKVCNWCLTQKEDTTEKAQNSSNSSSSYKTNSEDDSKSKKSYNNQGKLKGQSQRGCLQLQIKKQRPPEGSPSPSPSPSPSTSPSPRKRIITNGALEEKLRRTKSAEISNSGITKHVFRNKVRRYKLLDEVST